MSYRGAFVRPHPFRDRYCSVTGTAPTADKSTSPPNPRVPALIGVGARQGRRAPSATPIPAAARRYRVATAVATARVGAAPRALSEKAYNRKPSTAMLR